MTMTVEFEKNKCLIKDNNLRSQFSQKGFGYKSELNYYIDLFETHYLLEMKKIKIKGITIKKLKDICLKEIKNFENKYLVFKEFAEKGYIVKDGLLFGFDFRIYKRSKEHRHTEFVVDVEESHTEISASKIIKSERLANTINAKYIMVIVDKEKKIHKIKIEKY